MISGTEVSMEPWCFVSMKCKWWKRCYERLHGIVTVNEMQFSFMPVTGTINAVFILRMQEEHDAK